MIQGLNSKEKLDAYYSKGSSLISEKKINILPDYNTSGSKFIKLLHSRKVN